MRMRAAGTWALWLVLVTACSAKGRRAAPPSGTWRDQYIFIADSGGVIPLVLQRASTGDAEAKGWIGRNGAWTHRIYHRYRVEPGRAASASHAAERLTRARGTPVRAQLTRDATSLQLTLRTRSQKLSIHCPDLRLLGEATDPEGTSRYNAGRATLTRGARRMQGWLVVEETPQARPRKSFVDYGDFVFGALASPRGVFVFKRSRTVTGFDHLFGRWISGATATRKTTVSVTNDRVSISGLSELSGTKQDIAAGVLARDVTRGEDPSGRATRYEVWLLGGAWAGVVFAIRPDQP